MSKTATVPPPISWAQRCDLLYVVINVECIDTDYKFTEDSMHFKGKSATGGVLHEVTLNFLHKINPDKVSTKNIGRCIEFTISKAEAGPYWPKLTKDESKLSFLKVDFNKWQDENSDVEADNMDNSMFNMLDKIKEDKKPSFNDLDDENSDDSDDEMPNLYD